jgi:hypothetical protein
MQKLMILLVLLPLACGSSPGTKKVPQIDSENCVTELVETASECDATHTLVMHCGMQSGVGEAQPSEQCVQGSDGLSYGMTWCCEPSFADKCATLGLCSGAK